MIIKLPAGNLIKVRNANSFYGWGDFSEMPCEIELNNEEITDRFFLVMMKFINKTHPNAGDMREVDLKTSGDELRHFIINNL